MKIKKYFKNIFNKGTQDAEREKSIALHLCHIDKDFTLNTNNSSSNVEKVTRRLSQAGYKAYLVGGGVRDLLLNRTPKDFDVATNATPEQVKKIFRNCRIIGRRFRLAHVYFRDDIIEVATFRAHQKKNDAAHRYSDEGMIMRDNIYGSLEEDAERRDFTINQLYYDIQNKTIIDYANGLEDINSKTIRILGDAATRYREDPVRMLRAIRFAGKLQFTIDEETSAPFVEQHKLIWNVASSRLYEEVLKLFFNKHAYNNYQTLIHYQLFETLFPQTKAFLKQMDFQNLLTEALRNTDKRLRNQQSINPAFLFSVMLWHPFQEAIKDEKKQGHKLLFARERAANKVVREQVDILGIPKRLTHTMKEIWDLQYRLPRRFGKHALRLLEHKRFRAGYDFLLLRAQVDNSLQELVDWWTEFQAVDEEKQLTMIAALQT